MTTTKTTTISPSFYCNQKFWWLTVDLEKIQTASCCAASPANIDLKWLKNNPGQIFNNPDIIEERQKMLSGQAVSSCGATCWQPESRGLTSRRLIEKGQLLTHTELKSSPTELHIQVGSSCNLSCVYCCKQFSTAWMHDIKNHGPYVLDTTDDRYQLNNRDMVLLNLSQKDLAQAEFNQTLMNELEKIVAESQLNKIIITGGEPFLYLGLENLVSRLSGTVPVNIWTGLGVDPKRFRRELEKISQYNIRIVISAENTGKMYEFNRYGNTWQRFLDNIAQIEACQVPYKFHATVSNLTLFDFDKFYEFAADREVIFHPCTDPAFLSINMLDPVSKQHILKQAWPDDLHKILSTDMLADADPVQHRNLKKYLNEFATRRNLDVNNFFPKHFLDWVDSA